VRDLVARPDCMAIIRAIVGLGKSLGIATTVEGVVTKEQLDLLRAEGCTEVQGYWFSPPQPADHIGRLLPPHEARPAIAVDPPPAETIRAAG